MCTCNFHARRVNLPELAGLALKIYVAHWPAAGLLEAWLVLTSFKYHGNLYILIPLNQRLALTRLRATGRGTQREYSSKPLKHRIVKRILVFKR